MSIFEVLLERKIPKGGMIIEYGTYGYEFFVILKGKCGVYYKANKNDEENKERAKLLTNEQTIEIEKEDRIRSSYKGVPKSQKFRRSTVTGIVNI
jgi:hypothetical protein